MDLTNKSRQRLYWWLIFCTALLPLSLLTIAAFTQQLGADPAKEIVQELGTWAINLLWMTLAISPLRKVVPLAVVGQIPTHAGAV